MNESKRIHITILIICLFMATMIGLFANKMLSKPVLNQEQLAKRGVYLFDKPRQVKAFELTSHKGEAFTNKDVQGQWTLVFFGFTFCPDVCPTTLAFLNQVMRNMEDDGLRQSTKIVMVSVDPARDTPEKLAQYVPFFNPEFVGVTGEFLKIHSFATNLNAPFRKVPGGGKNYNVDHSAYVFLLNPRGDFQGFFKPPFAAEKFLVDYDAVRTLYKDRF